MITEVEARQQNLSGCDVFKRTHLAYKDDLNRDAFVVSLNYEAYKILLSSTLIGQYPILKSEQLRIKNALDSGTFNLAEYEPSQIQMQRLEYINLENFYIATGFELYFKSCLLQNDYVVNIFEDKDQFKDLKIEQRKRPVHKRELFNISGYFYDSNKKINILKGITAKSLDFSIICNLQSYNSIFNVSSDILGIAEDYRNLRNQMHFPGDHGDSPFLNQVGENLMPLLIDFINTNIVDNTNQLIQKWTLNYRHLKRLNYLD